MSIYYLMSFNYQTTIHFFIHNFPLLYFSEVQVLQVLEAALFYELKLLQQTGKFMAPRLPFLPRPWC